MGREAVRQSSTPSISPQLHRPRPGPEWRPSFRGKSEQFNLLYSSSSTYWKMRETKEKRSLGCKKSWWKTLLSYSSIETTRTESLRPSTERSEPRERSKLSWQSRENTWSSSSSRTKEIVLSQRAIDSSRSSLGLMPLLSSSRLGCRIRQTKMTFPLIESTCSLLFPISRPYSSLSMKSQKRTLIWYSDHTTRRLSNWRKKERFTTRRASDIKSLAILGISTFYTETPE